MWFHSFSFIFIFLPVTTSIYFLLNRKSLYFKYGCIIVVSLLFYGWLNATSLYFLSVSILLNYLIGKRISDQNEHEKKSRVLTALGVTINILILFYYKYYIFFGNADSINKASFETLASIGVPLAISFITFQQISFLIDAYRGIIRNVHLLEYVAFITYYPKMICGPIVRFNDLVQQFKLPINNKINGDHVARGLLIFSVGLFKKVFIADTLAIWAKAGFDHAQALTFLEAWVASISYTLQLYFDFSGYTDMAIGISLLLNVRLPINFNSPYQSVNIQEFWRRWHITLSNFLRDYIYFPMGGSRGSEYKTTFNILVTFLLCGMWHGAGWNFLLWGGMHGLALVICRYWSKIGIELNKYVAWFITFNFVNVAWVFFRANDIDGAIKILKGMIAFDTLRMEPYFHAPFAFNNRWIDFLWVQPNTHYDSFTLLFVLCTLSLIFLRINTNDIRLNFDMKLKHAILTGALFAVSMMFMLRNSEFLYLRF
jgi:alginate O-acetyltransferase complex protein AlgI